MMIENKDDEGVNPNSEPTAETKPSKKIKKKKAASAKGLETMFRNAYRAQLDMIALAATKANIMISLNGVIVSILMVTGGFIYAETPIFLLPAILFLITSAISIYFALSSASPSPAPAHTRVFCCLRDVFRRKASIRDLKDYVKLPEKRFNNETSNILIFEDFAQLPKPLYMEHMAELIKNPDTVYEKMSDQLYWLGVMADKKFTMLRYSYTVFRWGLILSILFFLGIKATLHYFPHNHENRVQAAVSLDTKVSSDTSILKFNSIYEPSGVQQLADGRLIIIEDEFDRPFHILDLKDNGHLVENKSLNMLLRIAFRKKLDDLEAITMSPDGFLYAITSHKRNKKGERKDAREQLVRFKIEGNRIVETGRVTNLFNAIRDSNILGKVDKQGKGGLYNINIEAISFDKQNRLMLCLRNPKVDGRSTILLLENPVSIFTKKEVPIIAATPILLDLQGGGIRAMNYDPKLEGYLLTNEIYTSNRNNIRHSQISFWTGDPNHQPKAIQLPSLINMNNVEGISPVTVNGKPRILLISDNGDKKRNRAANYLLLGYDQLMGD